MFMSLHGQFFCNLSQNQKSARNDDRRFGLVYNVTYFFTFYTVFKIALIYDRFLSRVSMHSIHRAILFNISVRPSVCLSVRPVPVLRLNEWTNCHIFDVLARALL